MGKGAAVVCTVDKYKIAQHISRNIEQAEQHIISRLAYIGEESVKVAREAGSYGDVTGNLRSSIGYVILRDGQPISEGQPRQYNGKIGNGTDGPAAAQTLLDTLRGEFPKGIVLIVCAGMHYAAYVENIHHKDVLASAELTAKSLVKQFLAGVVK